MIISFSVFLSIDLICRFPCSGLQVFDFPLLKKKTHQKQNRAKILLSI